MSRMCFDGPHHLLGCWTLWPSDWGFPYQRFSSLLRDEAHQFRNQQSRTALTRQDFRQTFGGECVGLPFSVRWDRRVRLRCGKMDSPGADTATRPRSWPNDSLEHEIAGNSDVA